MKIGRGIVIFFLSLLALIAEIILYVVLGVGPASSLYYGGEMNVGGQLRFQSLMVLTAATGILAPLSAVVELLVKKQNVGYRIMFSLLGLLGIVILGFNALANIGPGR